MFKVIVLASLTILSGCAVQPTAEAKKVEVLTSIGGKRCQDLGMVLGSNAMGWSMSHDREGAINEAKNLAADKGANTLVIEGNTSNMAQSTVVGKTYYCTK